MPTYLHEIFVSYASIDRPWVERFVRDLKQEVSARAGREVTVWWDRQNIGPGDDWNEKMLQDARQSRVFVPVVSPSWLASVHCQKELAAFLDTAQPESLLPAVLMPIEPVPPDIKKANQARFYKEVTGVVEPLSGLPRMRELRGLAQAIFNRLGPAPPPTQSSMGIEELVAATREHIAPQILEKCGWMRILNMTQRIDASNIYTEVNIFDRVRAKQLRSIKDIQEYPQDEDFHSHSTLKRIPAKEALARYSRLMILGKPGAGKTTFLRRLAVDTIRGQYRPELVPAYIEFRALQGKPILEALHELWGTNPRPILEAGRALLLLDGLDELPAQHFEAIREELDRMLTQDPRSPVVVTCRIAAREYVSERFNEIEIAEFTPEQIAHFARHWFPARGYDTKVAPFIKNMEENSGVRDLASSPLLLTMICLYFEEHQDLNVSRADLYSKGLDTILERWDATRDIKREDSPYGRLSTTARESLYAAIALRHFERGEAVFPPPEVEEFFNEPVESAAILQAMEAQHGLIIQRAQGIYSFSHLTFQEYLVARHFVEDSDPERWSRLLPHLPDFRWREVFLLISSMVSADYLVRRMHAWLDELVCHRPAIQAMLRWAKRKQETSPGTYSPAVIRAFYLAIGQVGKNFALDRDRALDLFHALEPARPAALDLFRGFALAQSFLEGPEKRTSQKEIDDTWIETLLQMITINRDLRHDFPLDDLDRERLSEFEEGHSTLIACLQSERVSPSARAAIEANLFLPWPEPLISSGK